ncbi:MAG: hypothetical protein K9M57_05040, partial [Phycisphaerae bacterium]|nr:hypothetical protein [Phycisphaerae bacterium]
PNDKFEVPIKLFNTTDTPHTVNVDYTVNGPLSISSPNSLKEITLAAGESVTHYLHITAEGIGPADIHIKATGTGPASSQLHAAFDTTIPVRPSSPLHSVITVKAIQAGEKLTIEPSDELMDLKRQLKINISAQPEVQIRPAFQNLMDYPYGCAEQTSSKLMALIYAGHVMEEYSESTKEMVQAGIIRLWSMQTLSGGISYWPGGSYPNTWGTGYAALCLAEAKSAGFDIDKRFSSELLKYIKSELKSIKDNNLDINTKALYCRVIASFSTPPTGWMNHIAEQKDKLDLAGLAHLAGAFFAAGEYDRAKELLKDVVLTGTVKMSTGGRLTSQISQEALLLSAMMDIIPDSPQVIILLGRLEKARVNGKWGNTLENAISIAALSKYQLSLPKDDHKNFQGTISNASGELLKFDHTQKASWKTDAFTEKCTLGSSGTGRIYFLATERGYGRKELVKPYNNHLTVQRIWTDRNGKPVDMKNLHVGDLVNVKITIKSDYSTDNVAIIDALPGGMEVENPKLNNTAITASNEKLDTPDTVEFLDDRVLLFCSTTKKIKKFNYAVRVTTIGTFDLPPIQASSMYDPSIASLGATAAVTIKK